MIPMTEMMAIKLPTAIKRIGIVYPSWSKCIKVNSCKKTCTTAKMMITQTVAVAIRYWPSTRIKANAVNKVIQKKDNKYLRIDSGEGAFDTFLENGTHSCLICGSIYIYPFVYINAIFIHYLCIRQKVASILQKKGYENEKATARCILPSVSLDVSLELMLSIHRLLYFHTQSRSYKIAEQGLWTIGSGEKLGVELGGYKPRMVFILDDFHQFSIWRST
jgi:hypothetical protein